MPDPPRSAALASRKIRDRPASSISSESREKSASLNTTNRLPFEFVQISDFSFIMMPSRSLVRFRTVDDPMDHQDAAAPLE